MPLWRQFPKPAANQGFQGGRPGRAAPFVLAPAETTRRLGEMEVVMYDERPDSPTKGLVSKVVLSEYRRRLMNVPAGVWHADHNIGPTNCVIVNFPTIPYDHADPDKFRLPLNTKRIPYSFGEAPGW